MGRGMNVFVFKKGVHLKNSFKRTDFVIYEVYLCYEGLAYVLLFCDNMNLLLLVLKVFSPKAFRILKNSELV